MSKFGIAENVVQLLKRITKQLKRKPVWVNYTNILENKRKTKIIPSAGYNWNVIFDPQNHPNSFCARCVLTSFLFLFIRISESFWV